MNNTFDNKSNALAKLLRQLRFRQNRSQEEVARASDIAHNYYGEIERGNRSPSRDTLLNIARKGLELSNNEINLLLIAAGFAPIPQSLTSNEMARLYKVVEAYLNKMLPYPALLVNQVWNIVKWNRAITSAFGTPLESIPARRRNLLRLLFDPMHNFKERFVDWETFSRVQVAHFQRNTIGFELDNDYANLISDMRLLPQFSRMWEEAHPDLCERYLGYEWTMLAGMGSIQNAESIKIRLVVTRFEQYNTLQAISFFPADPNSEQFFSRVIPEES
ncbi:helix-turn-helix domain-containing protein [Candidatus Chlorohelix sp.]|uniref:helix-turn-helix domain-containing protein n=1 Tax=Candidatus Chlorohelix sp. TaxID=3139201 RepID=UPI00304D34D0